MSETIIHKYCPGCKTTKNASDFPRHRHRKDGLGSWCKQCNNLAISQYNKTPEGRQQVNERARQYRKTAKSKAYMRDRRDRKKKQYIKCYVRDKVRASIKQGKMGKASTQRCFYYCDNQAHEYHHWHGYDKTNPLDVIALCRICHKAVHKAIVLQAKGLVYAVTNNYS